MAIGMNWRSRYAEWCGLAVTLVAAEWLRQPGGAWVAVAAVLALLAVAGLWNAGLAGRAAGLVTVLLLGALLAGQVWTDRVARDWEGERERRLSAAYHRLQGELSAELRRAQDVAARAAAWAGGDREAAFAELARTLPRDGAELAVAILEPTGIPWAWAGRQRLVPNAAGDSLAVRFSRVYAVMESRRVSASGRVVVASSLLWADSATPRFDRSLAVRFGQSAGVELRVYPPGAAPRTGDVFDYTEPTTQGDRLLFSIQPVSPDQAVVLRNALGEASRGVGTLLLVLLAVLIVVAPSPLQRFSILMALGWCAHRAPLGDAVGLGDLFSSATFLRSGFSPIGRSSGHLIVASLLLLVVGIWLRGRRLPDRWWLKVPGVLVLTGTPYLVAELARGITPPANGVTPELWTTWQLALTMATAAMVVLGGALLGGRDRSERGGAAWLAALLAVSAAVIGLMVWQPKTGWPEWYTFLWLPALFLLARPAPRLVAVVATAVVASSASALLTWGAELNGRIVVAQRDLAHLGATEDPLAEPLLERLGDRAQAGPEPASATDLYLLWRGSDLAGQEFPVRLALWGPDGTRLAELALDSLDLPAPLLATLIRGADPGQQRTLVGLQRTPGRHHVLVERLPSGRVLTAAVGPRTRLLVPARLARLVRPPAEGPPLYDLSLSPPFVGGGGRVADEAWIRSGEDVHTERILELPGGSRRVHAALTLRPMPLLLVRGALLLALDALILGLVWWLTTLRPGAWQRRHAVRRKTQSFQLRLAATLSLFFVVPAVSFTIWGVGRLDAEASRTRDLLITSALRDAVLAAGGLLQEPPEYLAEGLDQLSNRLQADLVLYSGGRIVAASPPILEDLAVVEPLIDANSFQRLTLGDELELTRQATTYVAPVRVGYRVAQSGPPGGIGILATPQLTFDWAREQDQRDLTFVLLFATLAGVGAAILAARLAAWALSRPVAALGRSARAIGQGEAPPEVAAPPAEFEEVFTAFNRMAADVRASQEALDGARRRTAQVLANVATGVVAIGAEGEILLANPRAAQLLTADLAQEARLREVLDPEWAPLVAVIENFLAGDETDVSAEVEVQGRTFRVQLARLGETVGGAVLALDDVTDVTQAARVLAWGEMARQVAHEIKNPLTPIRLGVQHLQRVHHDRPEQFDGVLDNTATRILAEIDRLDTIARAFSRFGLPGSEQVGLEPVDLGAAGREVAALYRLVDEGVTVQVDAPQPVRHPARLHEVKEVLGNLLENARNAGARQVVIRVAGTGVDVVDDGQGISPAQLPRLFEPKFSSTTSGAGLGLPIVRRLVEGWGARVMATSAPGRGTTITIRWGGLPLPSDDMGGIAQLERK